MGTKLPECQGRCQSKTPSYEIASSSSWVGPGNAEERPTQIGFYITREITGYVVATW